MLLSPLTTSTNAHLANRCSVFWKQIVLFVIYLKNRPHEDILKSVWNLLRPVVQFTQNLYQL